MCFKSPLAAKHNLSLIQWVQETGVQWCSMSWYMEWLLKLLLNFKVAAIAGPSDRANWITRGLNWSRTGSHDFLQSPRRCTGYPNWVPECSGWQSTVHVSNPCQGAAEGLKSAQEALQQAGASRWWSPAVLFPNKMEGRWRQASAGYPAKDYEV